jgi:hypothetical protein
METTTNIACFILPSLEFLWTAENWSAVCPREPVGVRPSALVDRPFSDEDIKKRRKTGGEPSLAGEKNRIVDQILCLDRSDRIKVARKRGLW